MLNILPPCVSDSAIVWLMVSLEICVVCQNQITSRRVSSIQRIYWKEHPSQHHINGESMAHLRLQIGIMFQLKLTIKTILRPFGI